MSRGYTIRIYVPDGDPDGLRIIDRMNWTGKGLIFPRSLWSQARMRPELDGPGLYILRGYPETDDTDDERPLLYIGQADNVAKRLNDHDGGKKDFWTWCAVFISTNRSLNRGHVTWLEHAMILRAKRIDLCRLTNGNAPQEPILSEAEKADTQAFLDEILQILPLVGLNVFDEPKAVARPHQTTAPVGPDVVSQDGVPDTVVVPAREIGFREVFLGENQWRAIRIGHHMLSKIRYCAAYITSPTMAVTHYAPVDRIEPFGDGGKYRLIFSEPAKPLPQRIPFADAGPGIMQAPRYTTYAKLMHAAKLSDLF